MHGVAGIAHADWMNHLPPDDRRMTDRLYDMLIALHAKVDANEVSRREDINALLSRFLSEVQKVVGKLDEHSGRILVIETERKIERQIARTHGAWAGIAAAAGFQAILAGIKHLAGWK